MGKSERRKRWKANRAKRDKVLLDNLRARGAACRNCDSYAGNHIRGRCDRSSDFYGICTVAAESICLHWGSMKRTTHATPGDER